MEYEVIRSRRTTMAIQIKGNQVIVRAPLRARDKDIAAMVSQHQGWIEQKLAKAAARQEALGPVKRLTPEQLQELAERARKVIPERVAHYAPMIGVTYGRITIRSQKTRWGSCSAKGNLNFNCLLMLAPIEVLDSVVVHELCHRKEMNHSNRFYALVLQAYPDYRKWHKWLDDKGQALLAMLPESGQEG